jgi:hypothetical protein
MESATMESATILKEAYDVLENTYYERIEKDFKEAGFKCPGEIDTNDDITEYSTDVYWDSNFIVEKNGVSIDINVSGSAIAEISYGRWTETFGYGIEDFNVAVMTEEE